MTKMRTSPERRAELGRLAERLSEIAKEHMGRSPSPKLAVLESDIVRLANGVPALIADLGLLQAECDRAHERLCQFADERQRREQVPARRKVVNVCALSNTRFADALVVCDDGTLWEFEMIGTTQWREVRMPPFPDEAKP